MDLAIMPTSTGGGHDRTTEGTAQRFNEWRKAKGRARKVRKGGQGHYKGRSP